MKYRFTMYAAASALLLSAGCDSYKDPDNTDGTVEAVKDVAGIWQLSQVSRNGVDITSQMNCGRFKLHLEAGGRYLLENRLPFPVKGDGTWKTDDPCRPFRMTFTEDDMPEDPVDVDIIYPIVEGKRQLSITHSPGCESNSYVYVFVKTN